MKRFPTVSLLALFLVNALLAQQAIVGVWQFGDSTEEGSGLLALFPNGYYLHLEDVESGDEELMDGMERGTYVWNEETGAMGAMPIVDTNGDVGLSGLGDDFRLVVDGDEVTIFEGGEEGGVLGRLVDTPNSILGTWVFGDLNFSGNEDLGDPGLIAFLDNGVYFHVEEIDPDEGEDSMSGIEKGTYAWDSGTGVLSVTATTIDTNGDVGIGGAGDALTLTVDGDTLTVFDGEENILLTRLSTIEEKSVNRSLIGTWISSNANLVFLENGYYFHSSFFADFPIFTGMERGQYDREEETFVHNATVQANSNGNAGFSFPEGPFKVAAHDDMLYWKKPNLEEPIVLFRVKPGVLPLIGAWQFGDPAEDGSGFVRFTGNGFLQNKTFTGFYIHAEDVSADDEEVASDGIERGLYRWNAATNEMSFTVLTDTNGEAGFSHLEADARAWALGDKLVFAVGEEASVIDRASEPPPFAPDIQLGSLVSARPFFLFQGTLQSSGDLIDWTSLDPQPESPWFPDSGQLDAYYQTLSEE